VLASITGQITTWIAAHGVVAVFALMAVDAVLPIGGELIMLYAGVIAAGVVHGSSTSLLGAQVHGGVGVYLALALAGTAGSVGGSIGAWWLGRRAGRGFVLRHGHWLHVTPARLARAEGWIERHGPRALLVGRLTPLVRSFISIPAGVGGVRLVTFAAVTLVPSLIWCFGFAAAGWALGGSWHDFHSSFEYVDYAVIALAALALVGLVAVQAERRHAAR
jgi:membrane protein DedA with SNARE-associated domain